MMQRPQPEFVVPVRLLHARKRRAVAAVARRAAELFRVVDLQQLLVRMAGEYLFAAHRRLGHAHRLARAQVARFAAVHQVHILHVNLPYPDIELVQRILHRRDGRRAGVGDAVRKDTDRAWRAVRWPASSGPRAACSSLAFSSFHACSWSLMALKSMLRFCGSPGSATSCFSARQFLDLLCAASSCCSRCATPRSDRSASRCGCALPGRDR